MAVFSARKFEGTLQRCLLLLMNLARRFYRVLGLRLFQASVIQALSCFRPVHLQFCLTMRHLVTCIFRGPMRACLCPLRSSLLRFSSLVALTMRRCLALCSSISACGREILPSLRLWCFSDVASLVAPLSIPSFVRPAGCM